MHCPLQMQLAASEDEVGEIPLEGLPARIVAELEPQEAPSDEELEAL